MWVTYTLYNNLEKILIHKAAFQNYFQIGYAKDGAQMYWNVNPSFHQTDFQNSSKLEMAPNITNLKDFLIQSYF